MLPPASQIFYYLNRAWTQIHSIRHSSFFWKVASRIILIGARFMDSSKGTGKVNDEGDVEVKVETVDYRMPAGREAEPEKVVVEVTHLVHEGEKPGAGNVVAEAACKVAGTVQSAKEAISGNKKNE